MATVEVPEGWQCAGIFVGGCVDRGEGSSFRAKAHAHNVPGDQEHPGWICVRAARRVFTPAGKPTRLLLHEYAHLLAGYAAGHGPKWQRIVTELGAPSEAAEYQRRSAARRARRA